MTARFSWYQRNTRGHRPLLQALPGQALKPAANVYTRNRWLLARAFYLRTDERHRVAPVRVTQFTQRADLELIGSGARLYGLEVGLLYRARAVDLTDKAARLLSGASQVFHDKECLLLRATDLELAGCNQFA
jgi:hypothetical protein